jgi:hypothetical protein
MCLVPKKLRERVKAGMADAKRGIHTGRKHKLSLCVSGIQFLPPPADAAFGPCGGKTGGGPLTDHSPFETPARERAGLRPGSG